MIPPAPTSLFVPMRADLPFDDASRRRLPQWWRSEGATAARSDRRLEAWLRACAERWNTHDLTIESQTLALRPGIAPGIPRWSTLPKTSCGELAIACLGDEPLASVAKPLDVAPPKARAARPSACDVLDDNHVGPASSLPRDTLSFVPDDVAIRFSLAKREQECAVVLIRPRDGAALWNALRYSARAFVPLPKRAEDPLPAWAHREDLHFTSGFEALAEMPHADRATLDASPTFGAASIEFARAVGGPLVRAFIDRLPPDWCKPGADVIVSAGRTELSPGWSPCLVGWHIDGTSRAARRADGKPDLRNPRRVSTQCSACMGPAAPTAILVGDIALPETPLGMDAGEAGAVWQRLLHDAIDAGRLRRELAPTDTVFRYGFGTFHTGSRATCAGTRLFLRALHGRRDRPTNEMRRRNTVTWPIETPDWPSDPCGVFADRASEGP